MKYTRLLTLKKQLFLKTDLDHKFVQTRPSGLIFFFFFFASRDGATSADVLVCVMRSSDTKRFVTQP